MSILGLKGFPVTGKAFGMGEGLQKDVFSRIAVPIFNGNRFSSM